MPGADAYATSKQCNILTAMALARETTRLHFNAVEPGFIPNTGLHREANAFVGLLLNYVLPLLTPFMKFWSTPKRAARVIADRLTDTSGEAGIYYDEKGGRMLGSACVRDPRLAARVVAETRALLAALRDAP